MSSLSMRKNPLVGRFFCSALNLNGTCEWRNERQRQVSESVAMKLWYMYRNGLARLLNGRA